MCIGDFKDSTWDRFFEFIAERDEELTDEEVSEFLKRRGINMESARERVIKAVRDARKKAEREERLKRWKR